MADHYQLFESYQRIVKLLIGHWVWTGPNMILTKSLWQQVQGQYCQEDRRVHEDIELSIACGKCTEIAYARDVAVHASSRRMRENPRSFFIEYQVRGAKQIFGHKISETKERTDEFTQEFWLGINQGRALSDDMIHRLEQQINAARQFPLQIQTNFKEALTAHPTESFKRFVQLFLKEDKKGKHPPIDISEK